MSNKNLNQLLKSKKFKEFLETLEKNSDVYHQEIPINKSISKYIFNRKDKYLGDFLEKYKFSCKKLYINKTLKNVIKTDRKYINLYFFINEFGYIPSISLYHQYILKAFISAKTGKYKITSHPIKAFFSDLDIDYSSPEFINIILQLTKEHKNHHTFIKVPFSKNYKSIFLKEDILLWDILVSLYNLKNNNIYLKDIYKFTKQSLNNPTSFRQLNPYLNRLKKLSNYINIEIKNNLIETDLPESKEYFFIPSKFYSLDAKNEFLKRFYYYIFYITQIKILKKDRKPIKIGTILNNSGINYKKLKKQKGFPYIEDKFFIATDTLLEYINILIEENYKNFDTFLDTKIYLKPKDKYIENLTNVLQRKNSI